MFILASKCSMVGNKPGIRNSSKFYIQWNLQVCLQSEIKKNGDEKNYKFSSIMWINSYGMIWNLKGYKIIIEKKTQKKTRKRKVKSSINLTLNWVVKSI